MTGGGGQLNLGFHAPTSNQLPHNLMMPQNGQAGPQMTHPQFPHTNRLQNPSTLNMQGQPTSNLSLAQPSQPNGLTHQLGLTNPSNLNLPAYSMQNHSAVNPVGHQTAPHQNQTIPANNSPVYTVPIQGVPNNPQLGLGFQMNAGRAPPHQHSQQVTSNICIPPFRELKIQLGSVFF